MPRITTALLLIAAGVVGTAAGPAEAALESSGHPLTTFDGDGAVNTNFDLVDTFAEGRAVGFQTVGARAGYVVIAGGYQDGFDSHVALLRLRPDGTQDTGFGTGGEVKTTFGSSELIEDLVVQPDDKIVVVGRLINSGNLAIVLRYLPDGALDTTFDGDGIVTFQAVAGRFTSLSSVVLQSDGKIVVSGMGDTSAATYRDLLVARLTTTGALDSTFGGGDGMFTYSLTSPDGNPHPFPDPNPPAVSGQDRATAVAVQSNGSIVFVGDTTDPTGSPCNGQIYADHQSVVGRITAAGVLDTTFNAGGTPGYRIDGLGTTANCHDDSFNDVAIQSDGKIVAAGYANTTQDGATNAKANISVARYTTAGAFDTSFDGDGRLWTNIATTSSFLADIAQNVVVLGSGSIMVGAYSDDGTDNGAGTVISQNNFAAVKYSGAGVLDTTFGGGDGIGVYDFSQNDTLAAMAIDTSGRPVMAGYSYVAGQFVDPLVAVARATTAGVLDTSFNGTGTFFKPLQGGSVDFGAGIVRQSQGANAGKVVVVGSTDTGSQTDVGLVRYTATGALDSSFSGDGKALGDDAGRNDSASAATVLSNDKIIVVGTSNGTSGAPRATVMRFNADSGLDSSFSGDGVATLTVGSNANQWDAVALQSDGKVVVAGTVSDTAANWDLFLARYDTSGNIDTSFDTDGWQRLSLGAGVDQIGAVAVQSDGKIVVGGYTFVGQDQRFAVVRFNSNGSVDTGFGGGDGIVITAIGGGAFPRNEITGIAIQADGRIVVGGNGNDGGGNTNNVIRLMRLLPNGNPDTSFDTDGIVTTNLAADRFDRVGGIALQHDEKIVVFGYSQQLFVTNDDFVIARYNWDDGSLDTTYGTTNTGYTILAATPGADQAAGGVLFPDGSAALGGTAGSSDLGAARFQGDPAPTVPGAPTLAAASDTGLSNSDRITNDNTPTMNGGTCNVGETTILKLDGSTGSPLSRALCRTAPYSVSVAAALADGVHTIGAFSRDGNGDSADAASTVSITVDTVALPATITAPTPGEVKTIPFAGPPTVTVSGTIAETISGSTVTVKEGATTLCTSPASPSSWSCEADLVPGNHTVSVTFVDVAGNTSTASTRSFTVKAETATDVVTSKSPTVFGEAITFTATVTASVGVPNSGNVNFSIDGAAPIAGAISNGVATLTVPSMSLPPIPVGNAHTITAAYPGDTFFLASTGSLASPQVVDKAQTSLVWGSTANPSVFGQTTTITGTLSPVLPGAGKPSGVVSVSVDAGPPTDYTLDVNGTFTIPAAAYPVGSHTFSGVYAGDASFLGSNATLTQIVNKGGTSVAVGSSANPAGLGVGVTFTATVTATAPAVGVPGGTVTFLIDSVPSGDVGLVNGQATLTTSTLSVGNHVITAQYSGSADFLTSNGSLAGGQVVNKGNSTTTLTSSVNPSTFGQTVTFSVGVTPNAPATTPITGTADLNIDGTHHVLTLVGGTATFDTAALSAGAHTVSVGYSGDANYNTSTASLSGGQTVDKAATTTAVTVSPNPSTFGEPVTFTATVSAAPGVPTPDGLVDFVIDGAAPVSVSLAGGVATLTTASLAPGPHTATANYAGTSSFLASSGSAPSLGTSQASTTVSWASTANPTELGQSVTFTATVAPVAPGAGVPTGTITITIDGGSATTVPLDASGMATYTTSVLTIGNRVIGGAYNGDTNFQSSTGTITQTVNAASTTLDVISSPNPSSPGQNVTLTATIAEVHASPGTPAGSVDFVIDGGAPVSVAVVGTTATLDVTTLGAGNHTISATYSGDSFFGGSTDSSPHVVAVGDTTTALTSSPNPSVFGAPATFTALVSPVAPAAAAPGGSVDFDVDGVITTVNLAGDQTATLVLSSLGVGPHAVTATYNGDANYHGSGDGLAAPHDVASADTAVTVASSANPSVSGQSVTFTATVSAPQSQATPDGSVTFAIDGGAPVPASLTGGVATLTTSTLTTGTHTVAVGYAGTTSFGASTGALAPDQTVGPAAPSIAVAVNPSAPVNGQSLTITVTLTAAAPGAGVPTGSVDVSIDGGAASNVVLVGGAGTSAPTSLGGGQHTIAVAYAGDSNFSAANSSTPLDVGTIAPSVVITSTPADPHVGDPVTITATVDALPPATGAPKGDVQFTIDGGAPITATLHSPASIVVSTLTAGTHSVHVEYLGTSSFAPASADLAGGLTVDKAVTAPPTVPGGGSTPVPPNEPVPYVIVIPPASTGGPAATGTVTVVVDGGAPITAPVVGGSATVMLPPLDPGTHSITISYSGDANYDPTSSTVLQQVDAPLLMPGGGGTLPATGADSIRVGQLALELFAIGLGLLLTAGRRRARRIWSR